jgi:hypothetical protein
MEYNMSNAEGGIGQMTDYSYAIEVGTDYLTDLEVYAESEPLASNIKSRLKAFFDECVLTKYPGWEVFSHSLTMVGNHLVITVMMRHPK